jgi:hypothetical protein
VLSEDSSQITLRVMQVFGVTKYDQSELTFPNLWSSLISTSCFLMLDGIKMSSMRR